MELGSEIARARAAEEGAGEQWFLTPFSVLMSHRQIRRPIAHSGASHRVMGYPASWCNGAGLV